MTIYSSVTCSEEYQSLSENWLEDSMNASVVLRCAWADRYLLIADILGNARVYPHGGLTNPPTARTAAILPFAPNTTNALDGQAILYEHALVQINYDHKIVDLVSESLEPTADFITVDHSKLRWGSPLGDAITQQEAPGKLRRGLALARTLYKVEPPLPTLLLTGAGGVNHVDYTSTLLGLTFEKETLLLAPPQLSRTIKIGGAEAFTVALKFIHKPEGWNKYWRAKTQTYEYMYLNKSIALGTTTSTTLPPGTTTSTTPEPYRSYPLTNFSSLLF